MNREFKSHVDQTGSPCVSCPLRSENFCGVLFRQTDMHPPPQPIRQSFGGASVNQIITHHGDCSDDIYILCHGWAANFAQLPDGRRQIFSVVLSGDFFSAKLLLQPKLPFSVQALTSVRFSRIKRSDLMSRLLSDSQVFNAWVRLCLIEDRVANEHLVNLGRRTADERIAHLLLSLAERLRERVVIREERYPFPLRQQEIADITGLTPVHVSRVMSKFRQERIIAFSGGFLEIKDHDELRRIGRLKWA